MQAFSFGDYPNAVVGGGASSSSHWGPVTQIQHTVTAAAPGPLTRMQGMRADIVPQETELKWLACVIKGP